MPDPDHIPDPEDVFYLVMDAYQDTPEGAEPDLERLALHFYNTYFADRRSLRQYAIFLGQALYIFASEAHRQGLDIPTPVEHQDFEICPHCHQMMPPLATSTEPAASDIRCEICGRWAPFIVKGRAVCLEHR
jgi:hypothetical protein